MFFLLSSTCSTGVVTSPNYPGRYPDNLNRTETVKVESGKVLRMQFTKTAVWHATGCPKDYVKITDGDGTILMDKSCGYSSHSPTSSAYFLPSAITTKTNTVDILFHTDASGSQDGWSLNWTAVTPGLKHHCFQSLSRLLHFLHAKFSVRVWEGLPRQPLHEL